MTTYDHTVDEFVELIRPEIEADVDQQIAAEADPELRAALVKYRSVLVSKSLDHVRITNLRLRLAEAEARLKPRLVETPTA
jgi:hypothetical protein